VTNFSLRIATENVKVLDLGEPLSFLCFIGEVFYGHTEHRDSKANTWQEALEVAIPVNVRWTNKGLFKANFFMSLVKSINSLPKIFLHFMWGHVVEA